MDKNMELIKMREELDKEQHKGIVLMINALEESMNLKIDKNHNETKIILSQILEQTKRTNGRVNKIEDETIPEVKRRFILAENKLKLFNLMADHPIISISVIAFIAIMIKIIPTEFILTYLLKIF